MAELPASAPQLERRAGSLNPEAFSNQMRLDSRLAEVTAMPEPPSNDLRRRVVECVEDGLSLCEAAARVNNAPSSAVDLVALSRGHGRLGYRKIAAMLRSTSGQVVNDKRVERIWRQEGLKVPPRQPKRSRIWQSDGSCIRLRAERPNHVWSFDKAGQIAGSMTRDCQESCARGRLTFVST